MGIFSSLSTLGNSIKTKFADEDFRDKLDGIGSILQGQEGVYDKYTKRKTQRGVADDVANAIANGQMLAVADPDAYQSDLGTVRLPKAEQMAQRLYGRPTLPMLPTGQPTYRRF